MSNLVRTVIVRNLELDLRIGVHDHEKRAPQRLFVSVEAELDESGDEDDELDRTLDYDLLCDFIRSLARKPHVELQETVARLVVDFTLKFEIVRSVTVETKKPDVFDDCEYVGVRFQATRVNATARSVRRG